MGPNLLRFASRFLFALGTSSFVYAIYMLVAPLLSQSTINTIIVLAFLTLLLIGRKDKPTYPFYAGIAMVVVDITWIRYFDTGATLFTICAVFTLVGWLLSVLTYIWRMRALEKIYLQSESASNPINLMDT
jgi:hypothetical protein